MKTEHPVIQLLTPSALETIASFEKAAWPEHLAASRDTLKKRFEHHHQMLGIWQQGQLTGLASWRLGWLDKQEKSRFPCSFAEYANAANARPFNAAFVYSLGIHPDFRGKSSTSQLVHAVLDHARQQGCLYVVGDGRCPSYLGSPIESIPQRPDFQQSLHEIMFKGKKATLEDYLADPVLNFYYRLLKCEFLWALPDFIPEDSASGGHRVIFCKTLS